MALFVPLPRKPNVLCFVIIPQTDFPAELPTSPSVRLMKMHFIQCLLSFTDNSGPAIVFCGLAERIDRQRLRFEHLDKSVGW